MNACICTEYVTLLEGTHGLLVLSWLTPLNYSFSTHLSALVEAEAPEKLNTRLLDSDMHKPAFDLEEKKSL